MTVQLLFGEGVILNATASPRKLREIAAFSVLFPFTLKNSPNNSVHLHFKKNFHLTPNQGEIQIQNMTNKGWILPSLWFRSLNFTHKRQAIQII